MRRLVSIGVFALAAQAFIPAGAHAVSALDSLVASERAFAAMAAAKGVRDAFLAYLAEGSVVFQPQATEGRKFWEARQGVKGLLKWEPSYACVSSDGDMGYTCGPWEFQPPPDSSGTPAAPERFLYGHFNSVWVKEKKVGWRVVADIGITHPRPGRGGVGSGDFTPGPTLPIRTMISSRIKLEDQDKKLSKDMRSMPPRDALAAHAAQDLRFGTEGLMPGVGLEAAQGRLDSLPGFFAFVPQGSQVARSGDLGFTYGLAERYLSTKGPPADSSVYLNVWRQEGGRFWKLALTVINPLRRR
jgi:ketosteroid isomerase-like protein